jgi:hypothetical protein
MTQGKIERYHRSLKNRILLETNRASASSSSTTTIADHESLDNLTPADVYFGRGPGILNKGRASNGKTSNNDVNRISGRSQPEPSNQMS